MRERVGWVKQQSGMSQAILADKHMVLPANPNSDRTVSLHTAVQTGMMPHTQQGKQEGNEEGVTRDKRRHTHSKASKEEMRRGAVTLSGPALPAQR